MADIDFSKYSDDERVLVLGFDNEKPMSVGQVGAVLKALGSDYWEMNGRELVLARLELGSTWLILTDIVLTAVSWIKGGAEVAKATEDLGSFAKKLKNGLKSKDVAIPVNDPNMFDRSVDKSIVAIAKAAEKTNSTIRIKKTITNSSGTETMDVTVTPAEAKQARKRVREKAHHSKHFLPAIAGPEEYKRIASSMMALPKSSGDLEVLVRTIVDIHKASGSTKVLERVADALTHQGRSDIAGLIRRHLPPGRDHAKLEQ